MPTRIRSASAFAKSDLKKAYNTTPVSTIPPTIPISGMSWLTRKFGSTPGGGVGGSGVCSTCSPTPRPRGPFQRATSRARLSQLTSLILAEQPFGKIYSLRQFRHLPTQLLHAFDQLDVVFGGSRARRPVPEPFGVGLPDRR